MGAHVLGSTCCSHPCHCGYSIHCQYELVTASGWYRLGSHSFYLVVYCLFHSWCSLVGICSILAQTHNPSHACILVLGLLSPSVLLCNQPSHASTISSVQSLSPVQLFATPWTTQHAMDYTHTKSRSLLKLMSIELVMPSNHLILCCPVLLLPSIFPASGSFPTSQFFESGGQSTGASASTSVLPMNIQN